MYGTAATEKRQRGGRKAKKKKQQRQGDNQRQETDWDEIYDPSRPTNVDEYLRSDERIREVQEWKAVLYAHRRRRRRGSSESDEDSDGDERPAMGSKLVHKHLDGYNIANTAGPNRSIRSSGRLLLRTAAHVAFPGFTICCRLRAGRRDGRRRVRPAARTVRRGCAPAAAARSIFSSSSTAITTTRHSDHLSRACPL